MFHNDAIAGSWTVLAARLDARSTVADWALTERALAGLGDVDGIAAAAGKLTDPAGSDAVIGALVRLAAAGDDNDLDLVDQRVARDHRLCERTLYRRRERTLAALRSAAGYYLAAVA